jgi:hypothetical protein
MSFWDVIESKKDDIRTEYDDLWQKAEEGSITQAQAQRTLELMWQRTHLDIAADRPALKPYYPTKQGSHGSRLERVPRLWWVDHATAGISKWGTLSWFSSQQRNKERRFKDEDKAKAFAKRRGNHAKVVSADNNFLVKWKGFAGAATHFVVGFDGVPFYVVNLRNRCWGEPKRNKDGIHVEMVNALKCDIVADGWRFWAGKLPPNIAKAYTPVSLDRPYRGVNNMMPYTWHQVITNIKLKRLCIAATGRMDRQRMSDHADWRKDKIDMGPLWPRDLINDSAFESFPIKEYNFVQGAVDIQGADDVVDPAELKAIEDGTYDNYNFEDGFCAEDDEEIDSVTEVQNALMTLYGSAMLPQFGADGDLGPETQAAVNVFQRDWNKNFSDKLLPINGIPTAETMDRLEEALALDERAFNKTQA